MFTVENVSDLKWEDAEHTHFSCAVKYMEFHELHPTGVSADDSYPHIAEIWRKANNGEYGVIKEYEAPIVEAQSGLPEAPKFLGQPTVAGAQTL